MPANLPSGSKSFASFPCPFPILPQVPLRTGHSYTRPVSLSGVEPGGTARFRPPGNVPFGAPTKILLRCGEWGEGGREEGKGEREGEGEKGIEREEERGMERERVCVCMEEETPIKICTISKTLYNQR